MKSKILKKDIIALVVIVFTGFHLFSQVIEWEKNLGGSGNDYPTFIQQTNQGNYIVAGTSISNDGDVSGNNGSLDYWIVKLNQNGELIWERSLGGSGIESAKYVQQTIDGGFIVCGESNSSDGDVGGNHGNYDYWIVKLAPLMSNIVTINVLEALDIQPNPSPGIFSIKTNLSCVPLNIHIYDSSGTVVFTQTSSSEQFNLTGVPKGLYFITLFCEKTAYTGTITIQ